MEKRLLEYTKYRNIINEKSGSYVIYVKHNNKFFIYNGIFETNIYCRLGSHLSKLKMTLKKKLNYAIKTKQLLFHEAFYQKLLMFIINHDISLNDIYFEYTFEKSNIHSKYEKIKKSKSDIEGFNGSAFYAISCLEEYKLDDEPKKVYFFIFFN